MFDPVKQGCLEADLPTHILLTTWCAHTALYLQAPPDIAQRHVNLA